MIRRHFIMNESYSEDMFGDYDWCIKYQAHNRIQPLGRSISDIEILLNASGYSLESIKWGSGEPMEFTYNVWNPDTKEGILGFKGDCGATFIAFCMGAPLDPSSDPSSDPMAIPISFNGLASLNNGTSTVLDYNITKIECPENINVLCAPIWIISLRRFCALEEYICPSNCILSSFGIVHPSAPFFKKDFVVKKSYTGADNDHPLDFPVDYSSFNRFIVEEGHPLYDSREDCGCIIETSTNTLKVGSFSGFIPDSVTTLGTSCFYKSRKTEIDIPNSVTNIKSGAFYGCSNLTTVELPSGLTEIGDFAFGECNSLISVTIPDGVTVLSSSIFYGCSSLNSITYTGTVEQWNNIEIASGILDWGIVIHCTDGDITL